MSTESIQENQLDVQDTDRKGSILVDGGLFVVFEGIIGSEVQNVGNELIDDGY